MLQICVTLQCVDTTRRQSGPLFRRDLVVYATTDGERNKVFTIPLLPGPISLRKVRPEGSLCDPKFSGSSRSEIEL